MDISGEYVTTPTVMQDRQQRKLRATQYGALVTSNERSDGTMSAAGTVTDPTFSRSVGAANFATNQIAVGTTATLVAAARAGRQKITLSQTNAVASVYYVGGSAVTAANGVYVAAGGTITLDTSAAIYALSTTASTISYAEFY